MLSDRVGGYLGYLALVEDARAYDLFLIAMKGESQAKRIQAMEAKHG